MLSKSVDKRLKIQLKELMDSLQADTIREDGRLERHCEHGIGHTVGNINPARLKDKYHYLHGCDGCCRDWKNQEEPE